ncbi:uncharacterized protein LOC110712484 [Chenopodium quinoa]|uniref:uncharacterized protein LOC110712484 n=1 Tax=Chenopodium quinoa TaxID=63459 RepID=UPI000B798D9E|nr:uncharacterized protein LOC110712484 [Chenopodium quinoa]
MRTEEANRLKDKFENLSLNSSKDNLVESSLNVSKNRNNSKKKGNNKSKNNLTPNNKIQKPKGACYVCGIVGHKAYQCNRRHGANKYGNTSQANVVEKEEIIAAVVVEANLVENKVEWILDTGASRHFCANKALMTEFEDVTDGDHVYMGNSSTAGVLGKGKVHIKLTFGKTLFLNNVLRRPKTYDEAMRSIDASFLKEAIKSELDSIMSNHTWDLCDLPKGSKPISCKWIFKKKLRPDGTIDKFKARLVIRGFT